jgi:hypothetical protein
MDDLLYMSYKLKECNLHLIVDLTSFVHLMFDASSNEQFIVHTIFETSTIRNDHKKTKDHFYPTLS